MPTDSYRYGASYSPLIFSPDEWERDLRLMQKAGMNLIRLGDVHGSWDRLEPQRGNLHFDVLGSFYEMAANYDIGILASTGASGPPLWLAQQYPDVRILSNRGRRYPLAASYHWACIHHPGYLDELDRYTTALATFATQHNNHFGWQITNEIGFPFLPTTEGGELELYCYCDFCRARFREWVQRKYETLEAVNHAWLWGTTAFWYNDWTEIEPPEALSRAWSGPTRWIDWRLFWQEAFARFAHRQHELLKELDRDHPTSINTFNFKGYDRFGTFTGLDQWQLAQQVEHIGYDLYPGSGNKLASRPEHNSIFLDHGRSVSQSVGSDFWLHEIESGPIGGWIMGPDYRTGPADIWQYGFEALGHDAKLMLYMPWREWDYQPLHWGALVDLDGDPTDRLTAASELGQWIKQHDDLLMSVHVPPGEVALLESKPNAIFLRGTDDEELLFDAQRGAYRALWEQGFSVDFITPAQVADGTVSRYRAVVLPLMGLLSHDTIEGLRAYVEQGGLLIAFARVATLDERGWYHHKLPTGPLKEVFGISSLEADTGAVLDLTLNGEAYSGAINRDLVQSTADTEVLAYFSDGHPAITLSEYGQGHGLYIATQADIDLVRSENPLLRDTLKQVVNRLGISPRMTVESPKSRLQIDPHFLTDGKHSLIFITNYSTKDEVPITVRLKLDKPAQPTVKSLLPASPLDGWHLEDTLLSIQLTLRKGVEAAILIDQSTAA